MRSRPGSLLMVRCQLRMNSQRAAKRLGGPITLADIGGAVHTPHFCRVRVTTCTGE